MDTYTPRDAAERELAAQQEPSHDDEGHERIDVKTCGECGRSWNDAAISGRTPTPSGRCPFEYRHTYTQARKSTPADEGARMDKALDAAEAAFWRVIAGYYPEAATGDFQGAGLRDETATEAVRGWLLLNIPAEPEPEPLDETARKVLERLGFSWEPDRSTRSALAKLGNEIELLRRRAERRWAEPMHEQDVAIARAHVAEIRTQAGGAPPSDSRLRVARALERVAELDVQDARQWTGPETPGESRLWREIINVYAEGGEGTPAEAEIITEIYADTEPEACQAAAERSQVPMPPAGPRALRHYAVEADGTLRELSRHTPPPWPGWGTRERE